MYFYCLKFVLLFCEYECLPSCMHVQHVYVWCPERPEEGGAGAPETGVIDSRESPCGCWELNPSLLEEQHLSSSSYTFQIPSPNCTILSHIHIYIYV